MIMLTRLENKTDWTIILFLLYIRSKLFGLIDQEEESWESP